MRHTRASSVDVVCTELVPQFSNPNHKATKTEPHLLLRVFRVITIMTLSKEYFMGNCQHYFAASEETVYLHARHPTFDLSSLENLERP